MKKLRIAVIGLQYGLVHARQILENEQCELAGICDTNLSKKEFADKADVPFYGDYRELIRKEKPDGVCVATPPMLHLPIGMFCMENGADVLIEKPIAVTSGDAWELVEAGKKTGKRILIGFQRRLDPSVAAVRGAIQTGEYGRMAGFTVCCAIKKPDAYFAPEYRQKRAEGGGTCSTNGPHDFDRVRYLCGDIEAVSAMKGNTIRGYEVEDTAAITVKCRNGAVGTMFLIDCAHAMDDMSDTYYFEKKTVRFNCPSVSTTTGDHVLRGAYADENRNRYYDEVRIKNSDVQKKMTEHFCRVIRGEEEPVANALDGLRSLEFMNAAVEALDTGRTVFLEGR